MWRDSNGFKHNGPSPYQQRKLEEYRKSVENEELKENKIKEGFIKRTPRGREVTELAYKHLGRTRGDLEQSLFD